MAQLVLRGGELSLSFRQGHWVVARRGRSIRAVRAREADTIQLFGPVELQSSARAAALARGVPVVFFTADGRFRGRLEGPRAPTGALQLAQARFLADEESRLRLARSVVEGKLASERRLLLKIQKSRKGARIAASACRLRSILGRLAQATSVDQLRGYEGDAARCYFDAWPELLLHPGVSWAGRSRRPPRDPVNACLSFGYTLLAERVETAVRSVGLLPGVGALHGALRGQAGLVFDLVEEFRAPLVDRMTLRLFNRRQLDPADFEDPAWSRPDFPAGTACACETEPANDSEEDGLSTDEQGADQEVGDEPPVRPPAFRPSGAVYLGAAARKVFLAEWSGLLKSRSRDAADGKMYRTGWLFERQARRLARFIQETGDAYVPFLAG